MAFMKMQIYRKGALYACDCTKCGQTNYVHEWTTDAFNEGRDAMQAGTYRCDDCGEACDADTFMECGKQYAGMYSAPGYLDRTEMSFSANLRTLKRELRDMYGDA